MSLESVMSGENYLMENALHAFMVNAVIANKKVQKVRRNMECRRKLEQRMEERKLCREISEFEFQVSAQ